MSVLFNHAIRYEWLEQAKNPIKLVRQSALRKVSPIGLETHEIQTLLSQLESPFRVMVLLDFTAGLRRSELFALKWSDINFCNLTIDIKRSIFQGVVGNCKTEASRRPVPLSLDVAADLWLWKETASYAKPDDWVFASPRAKGKHPRRRDVVLAKVIPPAAVRAGIKKRIGWHTFSPHVFNNAHCEWRECEGGPRTDEARQQSLYPGRLHASKNQREARGEQRIEPMILPDEGLTSEIRLQRRGPDERLDGVK
jgi:integrase